MKTAAVPKVALSRKEAAAMYSISVWTVDELIAAGKVTARREGRRVLVDAASMLNWYEGLSEA